MGKIYRAGIMLFLAMIVGIAPLAAAAAGPLDGASGRIRDIRTREVRVLVKDGEGVPLANAPVTARMVRHQFLFGCNFYMYDKLGSEADNALYKERWLELFNYGTVPFYFGQYQRSAEFADSEEARVKEMTAWLQARGVTVKGHPLIWHFPGASPDWLPDDPAMTGEIVARWAPRVVSRFPEIEYWDVLNEPTTIWLHETRMAKWEQTLGPVEVARRGLSWVRESAPHAKLLINDYNVKFDLWSFLPLFSPAKLFRLPFNDTKWYPYSYARYLRDLKQSGAEFDAVGLQSHMHMGDWPPRVVWRTCERYAELDLPLHFTEVTVVSGAHKIMQPHNPELNLPWPSTAKGEARQAKYVADFYTLLFSHPKVEAITWWDLSDRDAWMGAPAGLLREDLSEKPAYKALRRLIREQWWTEASGTTDAEGYFRFRGFCGDYEMIGEGLSEAKLFSIDCGN